MFYVGINELDQATRWNANAVCL